MDSSTPRQHSEAPREAIGHPFVQSHLHRFGAVLVPLQLGAIDRIIDDLRLRVFLAGGIPADAATV